MTLQLQYFDFNATKIDLQYPRVPIPNSMLFSLLKQVGVDSMSTTRSCMHARNQIVHHYH